MCGLHELPLLEGAPFQLEREASLACVRGRDRVCCAAERGISLAKQLVSREEATRRSPRYLSSSVVVSLLARVVVRCLDSLHHFCVGCPVVPSHVFPRVHSVTQAGSGSLSLGHHLLHYGLGGCVFGIPGQLLGVLSHLLDVAGQILCRRGHGRPTFLGDQQLSLSLEFAEH